MIIKIIKMQGGDQLIAGISELLSENGEGLGFTLTCPCLLNLVPADPVEENGEPTFGVNFTRWIPFSSEYSFNVSYASVVAIGEPDKNILETFKSKFGDLLNDTDISPNVDPNIMSGESGELLTEQGE